MSWSDTGGWATQNWTFNNRLQMTGYTYGGPGGTINHSYLFSTTANEGKLWRRQDNVSGEVVEYQYDSIHRLTSATTTAGTAWSQSFVYDGFGNMKQKTGTGLAVGTSFNISLNSAKNGGGTGDPGDIDNRILTSLTGETYSYAPDNKRITKTVPGVPGTQWFLWVGGMRIGTYTHNWNSGTSQWVLAGSKEDWYVAGRRVAPSDRLGSDLTSGLKLMPFGEEIQPPNVPNDRTKFATYHRDASGLDYADQRYYSPGTCRFMSSDPYLASGGAGSPSSWNRFAYVEGDPVNLVDPTGRIAAKTGCGAESSSEECFAQGYLPIGEAGPDRNGGMWCDQGTLPFISTPAQCGAYAAAMWMAAQGGKKPTKRRTWYLTVTEDCYRVPSNGSPVTREVTYVLGFMEEGMPVPMRSNAGVIWEHLIGSNPMTGLHSPSEGPPGVFEDQQSIAGVGTTTQFNTQSFSAVINRVDIGLAIAAFGGTIKNPVDHLDIVRYSGYVSINGDVGGTLDASGKLVPGSYRECK